MKKVLTRGTLGDAYIISCKLKMIEEEVLCFHHTRHKYWYEEIQKILSLNKHVYVEFTDEPTHELMEITSDPHKQQMDFFPDFDVGNKLEYPEYTVVQPHSGKIEGFNRKDIPIKYIEDLCNNQKLTRPWYTVKDTICRPTIVLLGTNSAYADFEHKNCINMIGKTSIKEAMYIVKYSRSFVGPEGLLSFVALSYKKQSLIFYGARDAVDIRIIGTPWEEYCILEDLRLLYGNSNFLVR